MRARRHSSRVTISGRLTGPPSRCRWPSGFRRTSGSPPDHRQVRLRFDRHDEFCEVRWPRTCRLAIGLSAPERRSVSDRQTRPETTGCFPTAATARRLTCMIPPHRLGGVDWATDTHAVCVVDAQGMVIVEFDVAHTADGLAELCRRIKAAGVHRVAIERPDGPVVDALLAADFEVVVVASQVGESPARALRHLGQQVGPIRRLRLGGLPAHRHRRRRRRPARHHRLHHRAQNPARPNRRAQHPPRCTPRRPPRRRHLPDPCPVAPPSAPPRCSPRSATAARFPDAESLSCLAGVAPVHPEPAADTEPSRSGFSSNRNSATPCATSPATAGAATPGPKPATANSEPTAKPTPTPNASSLEAGPTSSGAAGKTTRPTTPPTRRPPTTPQPNGLT